VPGPAKGARTLLGVFVVPILIVAFWVYVIQAMSGVI
jgi:hypothetical protein